MKKYYQIYGLKVSSDIVMEEALEIPEVEAEQVDVTVVVDALSEDVVKALEGKESNEYAMLIRQGGMFFRIPDVASYNVRKDKIIVTPAEKADNKEIKTYLLGSAFGYCMNLREMVVVHGGAIYKKGKGLIVTGESGAGKSTLACALRKYGYDFISDDVCAISMKEDNTPHINHAYPQQKLCRDAAIRQGYDLSELIYINEERDKFAIRLKDRFLPEGADFDYLFEIVLTDEPDLSIREIQGHEKLFTLIRNIYRGESSFEMWGVPPHYMKACATISSKIRIFQLARPKEGNTLEEMIAFVEKTVCQSEEA